MALGPLLSMIAAVAEAIFDPFDEGGHVATVNDFMKPSATTRGSSTTSEADADARAIKIAAVIPSEYAAKHFMMSPSSESQHRNSAFFNESH